MKIYFAHSKDFDFKEEYYKPIRNNYKLREHEIFLPHEEEEHSSNSRSFYKSLDIIIAECSLPATGLGIELGFAYDDKKPIYCLYKKGAKISGSLNSVTNHFYEYDGTDEMIKIINKIIEDTDEI